MRNSFYPPAPKNLNPPVFGADKPWLAPLAGYTDLPFRLLCSHYGAAVCETEMVSASGLCMQNQATANLLLSSDKEAPLVCQIFGAENAHIAKAAQMLRKAGWLYFDFNMGCPAKKVIRQGAGSALLQNVEKALETGRLFINAVKNPPADSLNPQKNALVGFKIRLGFEKGHNTAYEIAPRLEEAGADWLTLHPRFGKEAFTGKADWNAIEYLAKNISIPLLASGDLFDAETGLSCLSQTGATGVMYARGALNNPAVFTDHARLAGTCEIVSHSRESLCEIVRRHIEMGKLYAPDATNFRKLRSILPRYVKQLPGVGEFRQRLSHCNDWNCLLNEVDAFLNHGNDSK